MERSELYGLPLEEFTPARNALAKELRGDGRRDEAAEVAKLRKPSIAAWAVNQLVRTQAREVKALFKAGDALRKAQDDLLGQSGDAAGLRRAVDAERAAVEALTETARGLLSAAGSELTPAMLERVSGSLHAAALDEEGRDAVRDGCLERELRHVGLGAISSVAPGPANARSPTKSSRLPRASRRPR